LREEVAVPEVAALGVLDDGSEAGLLGQGIAPLFFELAFLLVLLDLLEEVLVSDKIIEVDEQLDLARVDEVDLVASVALLVDQFVGAQVQRLQPVHDG